MNDTGWRGIGIIVVLYLLFSGLTAAIAYLVGAPFVVLFKHTWLTLLVVFLYVGILGIIWDGALIYLGVVAGALSRRQPHRLFLSLLLDFTKRMRFFSCGFWPQLLLLATAFSIYGTGNITLISLTLNASATNWLDPLYWGIEEPLIRWLISFPINTQAWDLLYHSCWGIELFAFVALVVLGRDTRIVLQYCVSMILLFYVGRFAGVFNPVMGPAFYQPELFGYLSGSVTDSAMQSVREILEIGAQQATDKSGLLLGGVSANPSLHIGMVTLTSIWLASANRFTLLVTLPWVLLVWTSTVVLGWHYALDGVGGILLALCCALSTRWLLRRRGKALTNEDTVSLTSTGCR